MKKIAIQVLYRFLFLPFLAATLLAAEAPYEILLKGGTVIDPQNGIHGKRDVAIQDGKIAAMSEAIAESSARKVIDVSGLIVTPGLVDIHTHLYATAGYRNAWAGDNSVLPDGFSFRSGVTTMVDAGSAGWRNFEDFKNRVIDRAQTRVFALLNIVGLGMISESIEQNLQDMEPKVTAEMAGKYKDVVVGIKTAHYQGPDWTPIERAIEAGTQANIPVMVDFGAFREERPFDLLVTEKLRPGDIATHLFRGPVPFLDRDGNLYSYLDKARKKGVKFDVGHGGGSFVFRNAAVSIQVGFFPDSISTDLHGGSMNAGMMDMVTLMSKMLVLGVPLADVIRESTTNPAQMIHHPELGHLSVGATADIAVLNLMNGHFGYVDAHGGKIEGSQRLICEMTFKGGKVVWDWNGRSARDYHLLGFTYGNLKTDQVVLPKP
ncbi:MAG: amidohydrolase/deacetylase family metallohydrolase [Terriglobia bacterium]